MNKNFYCSLCNYTTNKKYNFNRHFNNKHKDNIINKPKELIIDKPIELIIDKPKELIIDKPKELIIDKPIELIVENKIFINNKKKKKPISSTLKKLVWNTYIGEDIGKTKCLCCKLTFITQLSFNCGHIIAESKGGETIISNLKPICQNCNSSMGSKNMNEFIKSFNKNKLFICSLCSKSYKTKKYYNNHKEKCNGLNILTCPKCMFTFSSRKSKSNHIKKDNCKANNNINNYGNESI